MKSNDIPGSSLFAALFQERARHFLARLFSIFLSVVAVTTAFWSRNSGSLAGPFTFLILTYRELAFPPGPNVGTHIEGSLINFIAICASLVHCNIGRTLAFVVGRQQGFDSAISRAIPLMFLVVCAFAAGVIRSAYPKLAQACRMAAITAVFLLIDGIGETTPPKSSWTDFVIVSSIAAFASMVSTIVFLRHSSQSYTHQLLRSLESLRDELSASVESTFRPSGTTEHPSLRRFDANILDLASQLRRSYVQAFFEPRYSRLHVQELHSFMSIIQRIRTELSWGETIPFSLRSYTTEKSQIYESFDGPATSTANQVYASLILVERTIKDAFDVERPHDDSSTPALEDFSKQSQDLENAARLLKLNLGTAHALVDRSRGTGGSDVHGVDDSSKGLFSMSLFAVSLIQIAEDAALTLRIGRGILLKLRERRQCRLWLPKLTRQWFYESSYSTEWSSAGIEADIITRDISTGLPHPRDEEVKAEEEYQEHHELPRNASPVTERASTKLLSRLFRIPVYLTAEWTSLMLFRMRLSRAIHRLKHSRHLRYALKNGIGVLLLSLPAFLPYNGQGSRWFRKYHGQWIVVTYIFVLETNTGATMRIGGLRLLGTLLGAAMACLVWIIAHRTPCALVILYMIAELPISWLILRTSVAPMGVVASITIPPVIFTNLGSAVHTSVLTTSVYRASAISMGILAAVLVNHFVFPRHCRLLFVSQTAKTLGKFTQLYISLTKHTLSSAPTSLSRQSRLWVEMEDDIRHSLSQGNSLIGMMQTEISLLPKPLQAYRRIICVLQRVLDLLIGLRRIRENIPKKETVADVLSYRKDFISCICISLFACEMTFKTSDSLPQFLPSPQHALDALVREKQFAMQMVASSPAHGNDGSTSSISKDIVPRGSLHRASRKTLAISYALAENALLEDLAKRLEELLRIMRRLHGTTEWIPELSSRSDTPGRRPPPPSRNPTAEGAAMTMGLVNVTRLAEGGSTIGSGEGTRGMQSPRVSSTVPTPDSNHDRWI